MGQLLDGLIGCFGLFAPSQRFKTSDLKIESYHLHYKTACFPGKSRVSRRLWRLIGRLTRRQGIALDDAARASMHLQES